MLIASLHVFLFMSMMSDCNGSKTPQLNGVILDKLLTALEKAYNFYESEFEDVNLDGIYGLRVSEGALLKILEEQKSGKLNINKSVLSRISQLQRKAAKIAEKSLPHLKSSNPTYYKKFESAVAEPWKNFKSFKKLDHSLYVPGNKRSEISFDEDTSDHCMTEMTGTGEQQKKPCQLSGRCWNLMMAKGAEGYALTHQALFLLLGEVQGCKKELLQKLKTSNSEINLQQVYDRICASMYPQMKAFEKATKNAYQYERDLYMEQAMVCGSMGYYEFLSMKRLKMVLGWQRNSGCFGDIERNDESAFKRAGTHYNEQYKNILKDGLEEKLYDNIEGYDFKVGANSRKLTSMRTMRTLLVEKSLGGGCMSHITGVATGLLGVYLRWAVHVMYPGHKHVVTPTTKQTPRDPAVQNNKLFHHIFMRKVMQHQPLSLNRIQEEKSSLKSWCLVMIASLLGLMLGCKVITRRHLKRYMWPILQLRTWDKESIQKRNI